MATVIRLTDGGGSAVPGTVRCTVCGRWRALKTGVPRDRVWAERLDNLTAGVNVDQVRVHRQWTRCVLHPPPPPTFCEKVYLQSSSYHLQCRPRLPALAGGVCVCMGGGGGGGTGACLHPFLFDLLRWLPRSMISSVLGHHMQWGQHRCQCSGPRAPPCPGAAPLLCSLPSPHPRAAAGVRPPCGAARG